MSTSYLTTALLCAAGFAGILKAAGLPPDVRQVGWIQASSLRESSGVALSTKNPQILWSHGDGKRPVLYAMERSGKLVGTVLIGSVRLQDWEDIASDRKGSLYVGDIGNNDGWRSSVSVHEIPEPDPAALPATLTPTRSWTLKFPGKPFDAESLLIWQDHAYVISKVFRDEKAFLYRFPLKTTQGPVVLEAVSKLKVDSPVTGADISPDGNRIGLVCKAGAGVIDASKGFDTLSGVKPVWIKFRHDAIEACCFTEEGLIATAESREIFLFSLPVFTAGGGR